VRDSRQDNLRPPQRRLSYRIFQRTLIAPFHLKLLHFQTFPVRELSVLIVTRVAVLIALLELHDEYVEGREQGPAEWGPAHG
jgi:hypothetical protein